MLRIITYYCRLESNRVLHIMPFSEKAVFGSFQGDSPLGGDSPFSLLFPLKPLVEKEGGTFIENNDVIREGGKEPYI